MNAEQINWWEAKRTTAADKENSVVDALAEWDKGRWPKFSPGEPGFACNGSQMFYADPDFMDALQSLRDRVGPIRSNSMYRTPQHNRDVGGAQRSMHQLGIAIDAVPTNISLRDFAILAIERGWGGVKLYETFVHIDRRPWKWHRV